MVVEVVAGFCVVVRCWLFLCTSHQIMSHIIPHTHTHMLSPLTMHRRVESGSLASGDAEAPVERTRCAEQMAVEATKLGARCLLRVFCHAHTSVRPAVSTWEGAMASLLRATPHAAAAWCLWLGAGDAALDADLDMTLQSAPRWPMTRRALSLLAPEVCFDVVFLV